MPMDTFWLCFVPLFIAVDAIGVLPIFLSLTEGIARERLRKIIIQSLVTASAVALIFIGAGPNLLEFLGITVADFMIAGGILLLAISLADLLSAEKKTQGQLDVETLGSVPLGIPLLAGPAVLTLCILLANEHGRACTALAVLLNIVFAGVVFSFARQIADRLGGPGTKTISKIASLFLAAIAVMLIRKGIMGILFVATAG